jgi:hypothetical protein
MFNAVLINHDRVQLKRQKFLDVTSISDIFSNVTLLINKMLLKTLHAEKCYEIILT